MSAIRIRLRSPLAGTQDLGEASVKIGFSVTKWTIEKVIPRDQAAQFVRGNMIDVAIPEGALRKSELLGRVVNQKRTVNKNAAVESPEQNPGFEVERFSVEFLLPKNLFFAGFDHFYLDCLMLMLDSSRRLPRSGVIVCH